MPLQPGRRSLRRRARACTTRASAPVTSSGLRDSPRDIELAASSLALAADSRSENARALHGAASLGLRPSGAGPRHRRSRSRHTRRARGGRDRMRAPRGGRRRARRAAWHPSPRSPRGSAVSAARARRGVAERQTPSRRRRTSLPPRGHRGRLRRSTVKITSSRVLITAPPGARASAVMVRMVRSAWPRSASQSLAEGRRWSGRPRWRPVPRGAVAEEGCCIDRCASSFPVVSEGRGAEGGEGGERGEGRLYAPGVGDHLSAMMPLASWRRPAKA